MQGAEQHFFIIILAFNMNTCNSCQYTTNVKLFMLQCGCSFHPLCLADFNVYKTEKLCPKCFSSIVPTIFAKLLKLTLSDSSKGHEFTSPNYDDCPYCEERVFGGENYSSMFSPYALWNCTHLYHPECLRTWMKLHGERNCKICHTPLADIDYVHMGYKTKK